ncbi:MAG: isochorismatase family cysteine hydrolase [Bacteroidota bacterium]
MANALIVIDVQNYFVHERAASLPAKIASHIQYGEYDHVLFTAFHNQTESNFHRILNFTDVMKSPAVDIHETLSEYVAAERLFVKDTYSAMKVPALSTYLETHAVDTIYLCGINIDGCVLATAFEAFDLGYDITVLENLCSVASVRNDYMDAAKLIIYRNLSRDRVRHKREA